MSTDSDLEELAERVGGTLEKTRLLLKYHAPDWSPDSELSDAQILLLARRLGCGRYPQWKSMMAEVINPTAHPVEREVPPGELSLIPNLTTTFHKGLVTKVWLREMEHYVAQHAVLSGRGGSGHLIPAFNEDCYMGPQSVVKYRFNVAVVVRRPSSPLKWQASFFIEYRPKHENFKLFWFRLSFDWRLDLLKQILVQKDMLKSQDFDLALEEERSASRVRRLFGLASPVRNLLKGGFLTDSQLKSVLTADCGFASLEESEMTDAKRLPWKDNTQTYQAVSVDRQGVSHIVMANAITVEEFDYVQLGGNGALPAFAAEGVVERLLSQPRDDLDPISRTRTS